MDEQIIRIFDPQDLPFGALSNNAFSQVRLNDIKWKSVSNYIYATLMKGTQYYNMLKNSKIKRIATNYEEFYDELLTTVTKDAILEASKTRFQNQRLANMLLSTDNAKLIYKSDNSYMGIGSDGKGLNILGKTYELIRKNLRKIKTQEIVEEEDTIKIQRIFKLYQIVWVLTSIVDNMDSDLDDFKNPQLSKIHEKIIGEYNRFLPKTSADFVYKQYENKSMQSDFMELINFGLKYPYLFLCKIKFEKLTALRTRLLNKREFLLLNYYFQDQLLTRYPEFATKSEKELQKITYDQIFTIKRTDLEDLIMKINLLFENNDLDFQNDIIKTRLDNALEELDNKIPSRGELEFLSDDLNRRLTSGNKDYCDPSSHDNPQEQEQEQEPVSDDDTPLVESHSTPTPTPLVDSNPKSDITNWLASDSEGEGEEEAQPVGNFPQHVSVVSRVISQLSRAPPPSQGEQLPKVNPENPAQKLLYFEPKQDIYLSPLFKDPGGLLITGLYYPDIASYYLVYRLKVMFPNVIRNIKQAHGYIMVNPKLKETQFDVKNYKDVSNIDITEIVNDLERRSKQELAKKGMNAKFKDSTLDNLLLYTGDRQIIYEDPNDNFLGTGPDGSGENFVGKYLVLLRNQLLARGVKVRNEAVELKKTIKQLNINANLSDWIIDRSVDAIITIGITMACMDNPNPNCNIIDSFYSPCNTLKDKEVDTSINPPLGYQIMLENVFNLTQSRFKMVFGGNSPNVSINNSIIREVWKYISYIVFRLSKKITQMELKNPIDLLSKLFYSLTVDKKLCNILRNEFAQHFTKKQNCIIQAMLNVFKLLTNENECFRCPQNIRTIDAVACIIDNFYLNHLFTVGKIDNYGQPTDIFRNSILSIFPNFSRENLNKFYQIFMNLDRYTIDHIDSGQLMEMTLMNRVNFFCYKNGDTKKLVKTSSTTSRATSRTTSGAPSEDLFGDLLADGSGEESD